MFLVRSAIVRIWVSCDTPSRVGGRVEKSVFRTLGPRAFDTDVFVTIVLSFYDGLVAYFLVHVQKQQLGL